MFSDTHSITKNGILFNAWPDGAPLFEQEEYLIRVFNIIHDVVRQIQSGK